MSRKLLHHHCNGICKDCDKAAYSEKGKYYSCDRDKTKNIIVISPNPIMRQYVKN